MVVWDLFVVSLSKHNQLQPSMTPPLFLRWPWWFFYKDSDRIPWHAAWTLLLLPWEGDCWVFPTVSCCRSWTRSLHRTESTLGIKGFVPLWMAVEISRAPEPLLSLHVHATQPGLRTRGALHHHKHTTAVSNSSHGGKDGISSWEMGKAVHGGQRRDQNHAKNLYGSMALKAHVLGWVTQDRHNPCASSPSPS